MATATKAQPKIQLPDEVRLTLECDYGGEINKYIAGLFGLSAAGLMEITKLIRDVYYKQIKIEQIPKRLSERLGVKSDVAQKIAFEICSQQLVVVDKWLDGAVATALRGFGHDPDEFADYVEEYKETVLAEQEEEEEALAAQHALENPEPVRDLAEEKMQTMAEVMKDPAAEKKASLEVFANNVKDLLESADVPLKVDVNMRLIYLLADDGETKSFQKELLEELYNNKEGITTEKIVLKNEKVEPTIGNWLQDYVMFVGVEGIVNSLKKAQYQADSANMKKLPPAERALIDKLFNLYSSIKNFYANIEKMELADIEIFPFTDAEKQALVKAEAERQVESVVDDKSLTNAGELEAPLDVAALYLGKPADRAAVEKAKTDIITLTRGEYNKVADELEKQLLARQKFAIIAGIEILAESGALDNVLATDQRYRSYLTGYFKRNNLAAEATEFAKDPHNAKYVKYFLRFVFLERLGMAEGEGARLAANLSNIFLANGSFEYGELAYLDLSDRTFKWE